MQIGNREPALTRVKKSKTSVEQNTIIDENLV
jgi:hypothetical protein